MGMGESRGPFYVGGMGAVVKSYLRGQLEEVRVSGLVLKDFCNF